MMDLEIASRDELIAIIDNLEGKVAALECAAEPDVALEFQRVFRLPPTAARLLAYLADFRPHTKEQIFNRLYADRIGDPPAQKIVDVTIYRLRSRVGRYGVTIETVWGTGYHMTEGRQAIEAARLGVVPPRLDGVMPPTGPDTSLTSKALALAELQRRQLLADEGSGFVGFTMGEFVRAADLATPGAEIIDRLERQGYLTIHGRARPGCAHPWTVRLTEAGRRAE